jgi:hypothetical protein
MPGADRVETRTLIGLALGGLGSIAVAIALVPLRDEIDNANLALILVLVVVLAAIIGGRWAAAVAAVVATMAFDFFLTKPFVSMRIDSSDDIETVLLLLVVGLVVGEVAARGRASRRERERAADAIARVQRVADQVATGAPIEAIAESVKYEVTGLLQLHDCWLELAPYHWPLPTLERAGTLPATEHRFMANGFTLPKDGVQLPVLEAGHEVARLVLIGDAEHAVTLDERVLAVALADQLGAAFASASPEQVAAVDETTNEPE